MEVILLERIAKLGQMGDVVNVKPGYARNYLLPQGKAMRSNEANRAVFETQRAELEARNLERKNEAEKVSEKLDGNTYVMIRSAGQTGQLYGSVSTRDIADALDEAGFKVGRNQVILAAPIKLIGVHGLQISLHPEVEATISVNVARSEDEAERQAAGEDLTGRADEGFEREVASVEDEDEMDLSEVFDNPDDVQLDGEEASDDAEPATEEVAEEASEEEAPKE